jgi:aminopeptidase N
LRTLEAEVGPYPFAELDLVGIGPGGWIGIEYPGEVFIRVGSAMPPLPGEEGFETQEELFEVLVTTVHEVGHQWFYGLLGNDQLLQPWVDEAATSYTELLYAEKTDGTAAARGVLRKFQECLRDSSQPELPIGLGIADYPSEEEYGLIVYCKGALFVDALRRQLGDPTFFAFLHAYYERYRYGFASARDFQATAEEACACNLSALFDLWVYQGGAVPAN